MEETRKYKQTELGLLPEDWEVAKLGDCTNITSGGTPNTMNDEYWGGDVPWMNSGDLNKKIVNSVDGRITEKGVKYSSTHWIPKECILIGLAGQGKTRGTAAFNVFPLCINQSIAAIYPCKFFESKFVYYYFETQYKNLRTLSDGGGGRGGLTKSMLQDIEIPLPPIKEQRRIASALTSIDNLIDSLDRLIAKKRDIKQGAMQQLLSGKKRLKGFTEPWVEKNLGADALILRGGSPRPIEDYITENTDGLNWIKIGDVKPNDKYIRKTAEKIIKEGLAKTRQVKKGDFILSNSMSFGRPYILDIDGCIHDGWLVIQDYQEAYDMQFLYYILCSDVIMNQYVSMAAGSGVQNLNKDKVADVLLYAPSSLTEQQAIASVLTSMDNELSALEAKRKKYEQIKQGMMQQLLTGRIRLN